MRGFGASPKGLAKIENAWWRRQLDANWSPGEFPDTLGNAGNSRPLLPFEWHKRLCCSDFRPNSLPRLTGNCLAGTGNPETPSPGLSAQSSHLTAIPVWALFIRSLTETPVPVERYGQIGLDALRREWNFLASGNSFATAHSSGRCSHNFVHNRESNRLIRDSAGAIRKQSPLSGIDTVLRGIVGRLTGNQIRC